MAAEPTESEPRWLTPDEREAWLALMSLVIRLPQALDAQLSREAGLSHFEYGVMSALSEASGRTLRMSTLAGLAEGSLPRLSQVVGRMEKRGWVRRQTDSTDGRFTLAVLTDAGWEQVRRAAPLHVEHARRLVFDQLTKAQVTSLTGISKRIMHGIDPDDRDLSGPRRDSRRGASKPSQPSQPGRAGAVG